MEEILASFTLTLSFASSLLSFTWSLTSEQAAVSVREISKQRLKRKM